jgi:hypothetical protein
MGMDTDRWGCGGKKWTKKHVSVLAFSPMTHSLGRNPGVSTGILQRSWKMFMTNKLQIPKLIWQMIWKENLRSRKLGRPKEMY